MSTHSNENITELNVKSLFSANDGHYVVPIYQRDYAWGEREILQLIEDIWDYSTLNEDKKYYIGTLVVYQRFLNGVSSYDVIDGQQRLTTFFILLSYLRKGKNIDLEFNGKLHFESRPKSIAALQDMYSAGDLSNVKDYNINLIAGYKTICTIISKKFDDNEVGRLLKEQFYNYLLNKVTLVRVAVPVDTDLNHYFEIMNNRGEQLEKTEIVKAYFLSTLKEDNIWRKIFSEVWEAASNMHTYVQLGFKVKLRKCLFGDDYALLKIDSPQELEKAFNQVEIEQEASSKVNKEQKDLSEVEKDSSEANTMKYILSMDTIIPKTESDIESERFTSVINFSNFLLQILKLQFPAEVIALDDKRLLKYFSEKAKDENFAKEFCFHLLKSRYLFDKYIIKRETTSKHDRWSLKKLEKNGDGVSYNNTFTQDKNTLTQDYYNKDLIMILSMFHVSNPSLLYKNWLTAALKYILSTNEAELSNSYLSYLERLAEIFLRNHYLSENSQSFNDIVSSDIWNHQIEDNIDIDILNNGTAIENFIFSYLDYKLWKMDKASLDKSKYSDFEFTFRSSVEHFYPQNPIHVNDKITDGINHFGNLCLISNRVNSKLSNYMPIAKVNHYENNHSSESIKQAIMIEIVNTHKVWSTTEILKHGAEMQEILLS